MDNNLKESKKVIIALVKGQQCSKCTIGILLLIAIGILFVILSETRVLPRGGSGEEDGNDEALYYEIGTWVVEALFPIMNCALLRHDLGAFREREFKRISRCVCVWRHR